MKRLISLLLALTLVLALSACSAALPEAYWQEPEPETQSLQLLEEPHSSEPVSTETSPTQTTLPLETEAPTEAATGATLAEDGRYNTRDEVALYIRLYGHLPSNYLTKKQAEKLGWTGGSLEPYAPGCSIGGSYFGNYEGLLPEAPGRSYTECDIDTAGRSSRGAKRIVFSNDGLIYYTDDHYESFTLLYGEVDG